MRTARVFTHLRCNQGCGHCIQRRAVDDPRWIARRSVEARIDAAIADGARELVFTGGEPTMRGDLPALVAHARAAGVERVVLETNATLIDLARACALRDAGVTRVAVNLAGPDARLDAITGDAGGFEATIAGISACLEAGLETTIVAVVVRSTAALLPELPAMLVERFGARIASLELVAPDESPAPEDVLDDRALATCIEAVAEASRRVGLACKLAPETAPPPCAFEEPGRVAHLYSLTPGGVSSARGRERVPACDVCVAADRCAGFSSRRAALHGLPAVRPLDDDRLRRRLSLIASVEEQVARELVTRDRYGSASTGVIEEDLVRINFRCNQSCRFCFVSTHLPTASDAAIRAAILDAARGGRRVTLSGGEPTLHPSFVEYVRLARANSPHPIRVQTNAIRFAREELVHAAVEAGLAEAFVSLHGSTAAIADAVTHAPGTFERTVVGIDRLLSRSVLVVLNFVICETNLEDLVPYVRYVAGRWPGVTINVSFVAPSTDVVPRDGEFVPRYSRAMPHLAEAFRIARDLGVKLVGFESMCGIPLCLVPTALDEYAELLTHESTYAAGEFVAADACGRCDLRGRCHGVRRGYAALHGLDELVPVRFDRAAVGT